MESCFYIPLSRQLQVLTFPNGSAVARTHSLPCQLPTELFWPFLSTATPCPGKTRRAAARGEQEVLHSCGEGSLSGPLALLGLTVSHPDELTHLQEPTMVTHGLYQWMDTFLQTRDQIYHGHGVGISDSSSLQPMETRQPKEMGFSYFTGTDIRKLLWVTQDFSIEV